MNGFLVGKLPLEHIGLVVNNMDKAIEHFESLGLGPFEESKLPPVKERIKVSKSRVDSISFKIMVASLGPIWLEVIQPLEGESVQQKFLNEKGEGLQHLCFYTDNLESDSAKLSDMGYKMIHGVRFENGGSSYYYDTDRIGGMIVEISNEPLGR